MVQRQDNNSIPGAIASLITKRSSVMTPLLIMGTIVGAITVAMFIIGQIVPGYILLVLLLGVFVYGVYRYEKFAAQQPWMLSATRVQELGMKLTMGDNTRPIGQSELIDAISIENPGTLSINEGEKKI